MIERTYALGISFDGCRNADSIVEGRFDSNFRCREDEPRLALCGIDSNPACRDLATAQFVRVVESGLGGATDNFRHLHVLPNPQPAAELWPDLTAEEEERRRKLRVRRSGTASRRELGRGDPCAREIRVSADRSHRNTSRKL